MTETPHSLMPRYLANFRCTASACAEDCCHGWTIHVDRTTYDRLKQSMDHPRQQRERFKQSLLRANKDQQTPLHYASIVLRPDGRCPFLDDERLCEIHRRFGTSHLSQICRGYPRNMAQFGQRSELTATLSCPEVARSCLLDPQAMELFEAPPGGLDRDAICTRRLPADNSHPYIAHLDEVRQVMLSLLSLEGASLADRLFFITCLADHLTPEFSQTNSTTSADTLVEAINAFTQSATLENLQKQFAEIDDRIDFAMTLIQTLSIGQEKVSRHYLQLLKQAWVNYTILESTDAEEDSSQPLPAGSVILGEIRVRYLQRKQLLQDTFSERLDQYFGNYARNYWFSEWYTISPNLLEHTSKLLIRQAILRFLLVSHPQLNTLVDQLSGGSLSAAALEFGQQQLDEVAVTTFYQFSRGVEHNQGFLNQIQQTLSEQGLDGLTLLTLLLKF